ncbi:O-antigen ligase family protein [Erythrobacter sp. W53]|uniref:O-antigen ligase family protein n=1 Tax=Erythrobacter sp. W53 TaxID=3425947 RepID=UPI003D769BE8
MRWVALAVILASLPAFIAYLQASKARRDHALIAIGALCFAAGTLQADAALYTWPMWNGTVRGMLISPIDTLAIALIVTRAKQSIYGPFMALIALFAIPILVSISVSSVPLGSTFTLFQVLRMLLVVIAVTGELTRPGAIRSLLIGLSLGLMAQGGFVIYQKLTGVVQASGSLSHQNILGMMVELAILPLIAAVLEGEKSKWIYGGVFAGLIVVAGGGSRGTMAFVVAGIAVLILLSLIRNNSPRKMKIVGAAVAASLVFVPLGYATLKERFGEYSFVTSEDERNAFNRAATAMADDHPLGVGANLYVTVSNTQGYADRAGVNWNFGSRAAPVHNAFLLARAETGWAGQISLVLLFSVPLIIGLRIAFRNRQGMFGGIALGSAVAILALTVHNNFEYVWFIEQPQRIFFINMAIIAGCVQSYRANARQPQSEANSSPPNPAGGNAIKPSKGLVWQPGSSAKLAKND